VVWNVLRPAVLQRDVDDLPGGGHVQPSDAVGPVSVSGGLKSASGAIPAPFKPDGARECRRRSGNGAKRRRTDSDRAVGRASSCCGEGRTPVQDGRPGRGRSSPTSGVAGARHHGTLGCSIWTGATCHLTPDASLRPRTIRPIFLPRANRWPRVFVFSMSAATRASFKVASPRIQISRALNSVSPIAARRALNVVSSPSSRGRQCGDCALASDQTFVDLQEQPNN